MRHLISLALATFTLCALLTMGVSASFDYTFEGVDDTDFLPSTDYEDIYGAQYTYGGQNVIDFDYPDLPYGKFTATQPGIMEKAMLPGLQESVLGYGLTSVVSPDYSTGVVTVESFPGTSSYASPSAASPGEVKTVAFTELTDSFLLENGAIGCVSIPAIGVKNMYAWQGETTESMGKGLGHFVSSSVWDGNVCFCGHNRGASYVIGGIKDMSLGDTVTYTTSQGTRTYRVETIKTIASDDWTYLKSTTDNRITLVTCVAGDYSHRWMLQAVEVA